MAYDLVTEIGQKIRMLDTAISELRKRGSAYAQAEKDYKIAQAEKILTLRDEGMPVTIISDVCKGDKVIAQKRFERDVAEVVYRSALEAINSLKLQIKIMDAQLSREWGHD